MISRTPFEGDVLEQGITLLRDTLPGKWQVELQPDDHGDSLADVILNIGGPQGAVSTVVEVKRTFSPKDVDAVVRQARLLNRITPGVPVLVMAPWLSDRSREMLTKAGVNYLDLTGNARFTAEYPLVFIYRESNARGPKRRQPTYSLKGVKAGRVVRLLADVQPPYGVVELARHAGVTPGYASRLLEALEREDLIVRGTRGRVMKVSWRELLQRRAEVYDVFTSNGVERFVCPNGPASALELVRDFGLKGVAMTGSFAAEQIVSIAAPALLFLYAEAALLPPIIEWAGLLPADTGANVVIATPYDEVVLQRQYQITDPLPSGVPLVGLTQLALDCLTGNGRMPQEGEALLDWMEEDESRWRHKTLAELPPPEAAW